MPVTINRGLTRNSQFARAALKKGKEELRRRAEVVGADAVRRANDNVQKAYNNSREGDRSRGGVKLLGSFSYKVVWDGSPDSRVRLSLTSRARQSKVLPLERGSRPHEIRARNAPRLAFPSTVYPGRIVRPVAVQHPGTHAGRFMRRALDSAVQASFRGALRRRRR